MRISKRFKKIVAIDKLSHYIFRIEKNVLGGTKQPVAPLVWRVVFF